MNLTTQQVFAGSQATAPPLVEDLSRVLAAQFQRQSLSLDSPLAADTVRYALLSRTAELAADLQHQQTRAAAARDLASRIDLPPQVRADLHAAYLNGNRVPGAPSSTPPLIAPAPEDTAALGQQWLNKNPRPALWLAFAAVCIGLVLAGCGEVLAMFKLLGSALGTDEFGNATPGAVFVAVGGSCLTLAGYILAAQLWESRRALAAVLYLLLLVFVWALGVLPAYGSRISELWGMLAGVFGSAGADAPLWWLLSLSLVAALVFTLPGLLVCASKARARAALDRLRLRAEMDGIAQVFDCASVETQHEQRQVASVAYLRSSAGFDATAAAILAAARAICGEQVHAAKSALLVELTDVRTPRAAKQRAAAQFNAYQGSTS